jgi:membrane protein CcdC involved in cytochrome C biogenesis
MEFWNSGELRRRRRRFGSPEKTKSTMDVASATLKRSRWIFLCLLTVDFVFKTEPSDLVDLTVMIGLAHAFVSYQICPWWIFLFFFYFKIQRALD